MSDIPDLPTITLGGVTVYDAQVWFPDRSDGGAGAVVFHPRTPEQVDEIAIHQDAVAFEDVDRNFNGTTIDEERTRMQASYNWHTKYYPASSAVRGQGWNWPGMGYHLYCFPSGRIYLVGDLGTIRAHVAYRNTRGIGVVGAGEFMTHPPVGLLVVALGQACAFGQAWKEAA